jgi:putative hydrolase of the HAD superfamily
MPGALAAIQSLKAAGITLGLISNAQFFTPLLFEAFFGSSPAGLGFDPGLLVYSYRIGEAKPSPALFAGALDRLAALGLAAENCLYVGNDMLNDIAPAITAGFKTLLFAGDSRSLRLRAEDPLTGNVRPAAVIRELADIPGICGVPEASSHE